MIIKEYRIPMPMTTEEYQRGQVYAAAESAKRETGGGDGIEVIRNDQFQNVELPNGKVLSDGQYSLRRYHIDNKVPSFIRLLTPKGALNMKEECYTAYPYSRTVISNDYLGDRLTLIIESMHLPDRGETTNALNLTPEQLKHREVVFLDIGEELDPDEESQLAKDEIPRQHKSKKTSRGPLEKNWIQEVEPIMCCYKVVTCEFKLFGLQSRVENFIQKNEQRIFTTLHRRMFCWIDDWFDMTLDEARKFEDDITQELDLLRESGSLKGLRTID